MGPGSERSRRSGLSRGPTWLLARSSRRDRQVGRTLFGRRSRSWPRKAFIWTRPGRCLGSPRLSLGDGRMAPRLSPSGNVSCPGDVRRPRGPVFWPFCHRRREPVFGGVVVPVLALGSWRLHLHPPRGSPTLSFVCARASGSEFLWVSGGRVAGAGTSGAPIRFRRRLRDPQVESVYSSSTPTDFTPSPAA